MPAPDDLGAAHSIIGWLFEARDDASPVATRLQEVIEVVANAVQGYIADTSDAADDALVQAEDAAGVVAGWATPITKFIRVTTSGLQKLIGVGASAAVRVNEVVQKFISLQDITDAFRNVGGGIFGLLFGPAGGILSKVLSLFSPLIDLLVDGLLPAVETFSAIVKTAFNPLFELAEVLAQTLAPMVVKWLTPFVEGAEILAIQAAGFVISLLKGGQAASGIGRTLMPLVSEVVDAASSLAKELLPVVMTAFKGLVPVAVELFKTLVQVAREILPELVRVIQEVAPPLIKAFVDMLKAVLPIIPPLLKLGTTLLTKVFAPAVIETAKALASFLTGTLAPWVTANLPIWVEYINAITDAVAEFFGPNLGKHVKAFKFLFIDPILKWVDKVVEGFKTLTDVFNVFGGEGTFGSKLEALGFAQGGIRVPDGAEGLIQVPGAAEGLVTPAVPGGQLVRLAEVGKPELVMPLTAAGVQAVIPPMLREAVELPGLDLVARLLADIHQTLQRGVLKVKMDDRGGRPPTVIGPREPGGMGELAQLGQGLGLMGLGA